MKSRYDFDEHQCLDIFIPGFNNRINDEISDSVRCAFSQMKCHSEKILGCIIDHSSYTTPDSVVRELNPVGAYKEAVKYAKSIGIAIGNFVNELLEVLPKSKIKIAGHSLGGQILGYTADTVKYKSGPLPYIVAIDPAGPCYKDCPDEHVRATQADLLTTIHCSVLGTDLNLADYDAWANNGRLQKGCNGVAVVQDICSHIKCVPIAFQPAILYDQDIWEANRCEFYENTRNGKCVDNSETLIGFPIISWTNKGKYYFNTTEQLKCNIIG